MRGILAIVIGGALIALAFGRLPLEGINDLPFALSIILGVFGGILVLAGLAHLRLRFQRYRAYSNGREKRGTLRVHRRFSDDSASVTAIFATTHDREWLISLDAGSIASSAASDDAGIPARAYLGDDDRIYGLDIGSKRAMPLSAGVPIDRTMREELARSDERAAQIKAKLRKNEDSAS